MINDLLFFLFHFIIRKIIFLESYFYIFFFSLQNNPYTLKETGPSSEMSAWTSAGLQPTTGYYPYDPTLAAYRYVVFSFYSTKKKFLHENLN